MHKKPATVLAACGIVAALAAPATATAVHYQPPGTTPAVTQSQTAPPSTVAAAIKAANYKSGTVHNTTVRMVNGRPVTAAQAAKSGCHFVQIRATDYDYTTHNAYYGSYSYHHHNSYEYFAGTCSLFHASVRSTTWAYFHEWSYRVSPLPKVLLFNDGCNPTNKSDPKHYCSTEGWWSVDSNVFHSYPLLFDYHVTVKRAQVHFTVWTTD